ncbi:hypothetical protein GCM10010493_62950 [Streptomyces lavendulae subsp. grasserius]
MISPLGRHGAFHHPQGRLGAAGVDVGDHVEVPDTLATVDGLPKDEPWQGPPRCPSPECPRPAHRTDP